MLNLAHAIVSPGGSLPVRVAAVARGTATMSPAGLAQAEAVLGYGPLLEKRREMSEEVTDAKAVQLSCCRCRPALSVCAAFGWPGSCARAAAGTSAEPDRAALSTQGRAVSNL